LEKVEGRITNRPKRNDSRREARGNRGRRKHKQLLKVPPWKDMKELTSFKSPKSGQRRRD